MSVLQILPLPKYEDVATSADLSFLNVPPPSYADATVQTPLTSDRPAGGSN